jgi:hypothetical protein
MIDSHSTRRIDRRAAGLVSALVLAGSAFAGCRSAYYSTMEAFGVHKRELLVDRVEEGRDAQEAAKEEFQDALEAFRAMSGFRGEEGLETIHSKLSRQLQRSEARAEEVRARIGAIERVAGDLFEEWQDEIRRIQKRELRARSQELLAQTRERYEDLIEAMNRAEQRMEPVLSVFRDHVLFLKHNLNAQAIASLRGDLEEVEADVGALIREMEAAIAESEAFLARMQAPR